MEWIAETAPGLSDVQILNRKDIGEFILITYDRDFGVLYSRLGRAEPRYIADRICQILESCIVTHQIHVIKNDGIRSTPFPSGA